MIGFYNYTVILTYIGTVSGFAGIVCILSDNWKAALICLMVAGFCDMFDGKIASTKKRTVKEKRFGIQIDSLSDLICFGVLPALITFCLGEANVIRFIVAALYLICALVRLAWFNVDEEERQDSEAGRRAAYLGLPVTTIAMILPFSVLISIIADVSSAQVSLYVSMAAAIAFLSPFNIKKPGRSGQVIIIIVGAVTLILLGSGVEL